MSVLADDQVVVHRNPERLCDLDDRLRHLDAGLGARVGLPERRIDSAVHNRPSGEIRLAQPVESDSLTPNMESCHGEESKEGHEEKGQEEEIGWPLRQQRPW
jgi:hypothetical protein